MTHTTSSAPQMTRTASVVAAAFPGKAGGTGGVAGEDFFSRMLGSILGEAAVPSTVAKGVAIPGVPAGEGKDGSEAGNGLAALLDAGSDEDTSDVASVVSTLMAGAQADSSLVAATLASTTARADARPGSATSMAGSGSAKIAAAIAPGIAPQTTKTGIAEVSASPLQIDAESDNRLLKIPVPHAAKIEGQATPLPGSFPPPAGPAGEELGQGIAFGLNASPGSAAAKATGPVADGNAVSDAGQAPEIPIFGKDLPLTQGNAHRGADRPDAFANGVAKTARPDLAPSPSMPLAAKADSDAPRSGMVFGQPITITSERSAKASRGDARQGRETIEVATTSMPKLSAATMASVPSPAPVVVPTADAAPMPVGGLSPNISANGAPMAEVTSGGTIEPEAALPPLLTERPEWEAELVERISANLNEFGTSIDMELAPETLGSLEVRVDLRDGRAEVSFLTETRDAARLLTQAENRLSDLLSRSGFSLAGQDASHRDPSQGRQQGEGPGSPRALRNAAAGPETENQSLRPRQADGLDLIA